MLTAIHAARGDTESFTTEDSFVRLLRLERRRSERSRKPFLLVLVEACNHVQSGSGQKKWLARAISALSSSTRETDTIGWYKENHTIGMLFTEIGTGDRRTVGDVIQAKIWAALRQVLDPADADQIQMSAFFFPDDSDETNLKRMANPKLYPDLSSENGSKQFPHLVKRAMDIGSSLSALVALSPLFVVIAVAIKLGSKGPVLFKQERVGQFGRRFTFLKFRSMYLANDPTVHQEFVKRFIAGQVESGQTRDKNGNGVYKLTHDPRITPLGRFLRKTSLDELPQFWNVLKGEMSLVGPRPPIPYELDNYDIWHRQRVLEVKPGITGLWQVSGRSKTKFDDMVRLDLRYARTWSPWLDLKILLKTPWAVLSAEGAY